MGLKVWYLGHADRPAADHPDKTFDDYQDSVTVGRDVACDISLPDEHTDISRKHFGISLSRATGAYRFEITETKPVYRNGLALFSGDELTSDDLLRLGRPDGPALRIRATRPDIASNMPRTRDNAPAGGAPGKGIRILGVRVTKLAMAATAGGILLLTGLLFLGVFQEKQRIVTERAIRATIEDQTAQEIVKQNKAAVYLVAMRIASGEIQGQATAFAIDHPAAGKVLATNAHVAELKAYADEAGAQLLAIPVGGGTPLTITSVEFHPGWQLFSDFADSVQTLQATYLARPISFAPSYDVAIMRVDDPKRLETTVTLASPKDAPSLSTAEPLMLIGYPAEELIGTDETKPEPTVQKGSMTALTSFFMSGADKFEKYLVQHSIPATGGASGSPIFDRTGRVVALLNAGNINARVDVNREGKVERKRSPSAALVNFAQRSDLLLDLGKSADDRERLAGVISKILSEAKLNLLRAPEKEVASLEREFLSRHPDAKKLVDLKNEPLGEAVQYLGTTMAARSISIVVQEGKSYALFGYSSVPISTAIMAGQEAVTQVSSPGPMQASTFRNLGAITKGDPTEVIVLASTPEQGEPGTDSPPSLARFAIYEFETAPSSP